jgi:hypothetical protein
MFYKQDGGRAKWWYGPPAHACGSYILGTNRTNSEDAADVVEYGVQSTKYRVCMFQQNPWRRRSLN